VNKYPKILEALTDNKKSSRNMTKKETLKKLISFLKEWDKNKPAELKVLPRIFYSTRLFIPLVKGVKGGHPEFNLEEMIEAIEGGNTKG